MEAKTAQWTKTALYLAQILAGNTIYALAVVLFLIPNGLVSGGTTGLSLFLNRILGISVSGFVLAFNMIMFIWGAAALGKEFAFTTLLSTVFYPVVLGVLQRLPGVGKMTENRMLATVFAGLLIGVGIGLVIRAGASTGGMDIPPLVLHKAFGIPVSVSLYVLDFVILFTQLLFTDREMILYGILLVMIYTATLDKVLVSGTARMQVKIVSQRYHELTESIIQQLDRGATLLEAETGFYHKETRVVLTVVTNRELARLNVLVQEIDPKAFLVISRVNEVRGRGFTQDKVYHHKRSRGRHI